ncbi:hypothetical protein FRACYDRAFT_232672 [Fragilariopsis cylindrus CCMP1102]|uniref:Uncharacterized protein n=1 Tax=Fragilariopsis cylindrus CCMP1102 TaxID=635003 RepID=A0A1E7FWL4_9STRA|nr:hypothetical protein FRACYDRAFT_232672 [Fragilariopsis cylindrus CCMP1102]|eukprot:OEU22514.1 hypothetical protein FRACYDRAFT_232672 [Fragilariopsis cylindrus CCMP1102]
MNVQNLRKRVTRSLSRIEAQEKQMKKRAKLHYDEKSNNGLESATSCYKDSNLAGKEVMKCDKISNADQKLTTEKNSTTSESISHSVSSIGKRSRKIKSNEEEEEGNEETHNEAAKAPVTATATAAAAATKEKQVILRKSSIRRTKKNNGLSSTSSALSTAKAQTPALAPATIASKEKQVIPRKSSIRSNKQINVTSSSSSSSPSPSSALSTAIASISGSLPTKTTSSPFLSSSSSGGSSSNNKDQQKCAVPLVAVTARNNLISSGVIIPRSVNYRFLYGTLLDNLNILQSSSLINDAFKEFDEAVRVKGRSIHNHRAYLIGVLKRNVILKKRTAKGSGTDSLPMGLGEGITPPIHIRLQKLLNDGFCSSYEINEMVKPKLCMLSEKVAMIVLDELTTNKHKKETKSSIATVEKKKSFKYNAEGEANSTRWGPKLERSVRLTVESCNPSHIESTKENIQPELASSAVVDDDVYMKDIENQTIDLDEAFFNGVASDIYETISTPQKMVLMDNVSGTDKRTYSSNVSPFSQWLEGEIFNEPT